jgi:hypothetical protein
VLYTEHWLKGIKRTEQGTGLPFPNKHSDWRYK